MSTFSNLKGVVRLHEEPIEWRMINDGYRKLREVNARIRRGRAMVPFMVCCVILAAPTPNVAQIRSLSVKLENDAFGRWGDDDYTNGIRVNVDFVGAPKRLPFSSSCNDANRQQPFPCNRATLMFGHSMYTPRNICSREVQEYDRPYAAWLYFAVAARYVFAAQRVSFELHLGTTGRAAFGETIQTRWHSFVGSPKPSGWAHQVEPVQGNVGFVTILEHKRVIDLIVHDSIRWADFVGFSQVTFGNVHKNLAVGGILSLGYNLKHPWEEKIDPTRFRKYMRSASLQRRMPEFSRVPPKWSLKGFVGAEMRFVGWNALLQHRTYTQFQRRRINYRVVDMEAGVGLEFWRIYLSYRFVRRGPEIENGRVSKFGAIHVYFNLVERTAF